jgi:superfamily I DNA and/or RNA helicase
LYSNYSIRDLLRKFSPTFILTEEGFQIQAFVSLLALFPYYRSTKKIISGDIAQLAPCVVSDNHNDAGHVAKCSLFERMLQSRLKDTKLLFQYRMAPDIAEFVSGEFYNSELQTDQSCVDRQQTKC